MKIRQNLTRILTLLVVLSSLTVFSATPAAKKGEYILFVGTYTEEGSKSKGIYAYNYDAKTGKVTPLGLAAETTNPSWVRISPNGRFLYAVNEIANYKGRKSGGLSAFSIDRDKDGRPTGKLTFLNEVPTQGADPCYVTVDRTGKYAMVANYTGGSLIVFRIHDDGSLGNPSAFMEHTGHGPNLQRQRSAHVHSADLSPDNRFAYVDDLGIDGLLVYQFDASKGVIAANSSNYATFDPGSGPRHFALHPSGKFAYVVSEMQGTVTAFSNDPATGTLQRLQTISTLPKDFKGEIEDAEVEIHPSGKFLYASNRGDGNSIAVFTIDAEKGTLTPVEYTPTGGKTPRTFEIDPTGTLLFAANQQSDNIVVFKIDKKKGRLTPTGQALDVASPTCVKFLKIE
ncbi:MAG TPA: lactonase family protein [Terriglobales bacterium]|nr:lactonase family protein [Terriglobales bacterium]